jgi:hypothetical protein
MYYLYHIKGKKWGCAENLERRLKNQGYSIDNLDRLIIVGNIDMASDMEKQLNIEYGYPWNDAVDYRQLCQMAKKSGKLQRTQKQINALSNIGKKTGPKNILKAIEARDPYIGESNPRATLTESQVIDIRKEFDNPNNIRYGILIKLASQYNTTIHAIRKVCYRTTWKHLP